MGTRRQRTRSPNRAGSVYRQTDGRWRAAISLGRDENGKLVRKVAYGKTESEARTKLIELQAQHQTGALAPTKGRAPSLSDYLSGWLASRDGKVAHGTAKRYRSLMVEHVFSHPVARTQVTKVTAAQVETVLSSVTRKGRAARTAFHVRAVLRTALNDAVDAGLIVRNPAAIAKPPRVRQAEMLTLNSAQVKTLVEASRGHQDGPLWTFLVASGVRLGEALGSRWSDYDASKGTLTIRRQLQRQDGRYVLADLKTAGSTRTLRLTTLARAVLERQREQQADDRAAVGDKWMDDDVSALLIFRSRTGSPMDGPAITHRFRQYISEQTTLPAIRLHDLRHTYATLALANGASVVEVSRSLGHSKTSVTVNVYGHWSDEGQVQLAAKLDAVFNT